MIVCIAAGIAALAFFWLWSCTSLFHLGRVDESRFAAPPPDTVLPGAEPVARTAPGNRRALFCIHGFPSSPLVFSEMADAALAKGFDLYAPLWPGCGTRPENLDGLDWATVYASQREAYLELRSKYDAVFLVGESMGGSVALGLAEEFNGDGAGPGGAAGNACAGIATIGSPVVMNSLLRHGMVLAPLLYLSRFVGLFAPSIGAKVPAADRPSFDGDARWVGYLGVWPRFSYTMWMGLRAIERKLRRVRCPALVMHCRTDRIIDFRNAAIIQRNVGSKIIRAYTANMDDQVHERHSLLLYDSERTQVWTVLLAFFDFVAAR